MFNDPFIKLNRHTGWIEAITGSMFSGKTEELIRRLKRAMLANQKVTIFKPIVDTRFSTNKIVTHNDTSMPSKQVNHSSEIIPLANKMDVVGIDEGQFFDPDLPETCNSLANQGIRVIVAGLDMDYTGKPFGSMATILAIAESVTKLQAICLGCGNPAHYSHRKTSDDNQILIGAEEVYKPLCRTCYAELT